MKRRLTILALAPAEFVMLIIAGAWRGGVDAIDNIRSAWADLKQGAK